MIYMLFVRKCFFLALLSTRYFLYEPDSVHVTDCDSCPHQLQLCFLGVKTLKMSLPSKCSPTLTQGQPPAAHHQFFRITAQLLLWSSALQQVHCDQNGFYLCSPATGYFCLAKWWDIRSSRSHIKYIYYLFLPSSSTSNEPVCSFKNRHLQKDLPPTKGLWLTINSAATS